MLRSENNTGDELAAHRRPAVGVDRELVRADALFDARRFDQALRQAGVLVRRDHPAHDVATEEIEDHIQRVIEIRDRALQLGDVPRPDLIGAVATSWARVHRMPRLRARRRPWFGRHGSGVGGFGLPGLL